VIPDIVRERGPLTVAAFMDLALYDQQYGYYARSAQRSGRAGDFFTSVDVGPLFGELLGIQIAEMAELLSASAPSASSAGFDLVEAGAGNGRLAADVLRAMRHRDPEIFDRVRLTLVEAGSAARAAQRETLAGVLARPFDSLAALPDSFEGVLFANELLDALPVHQVVMRDEGLREVHVTASATTPPLLTTMEDRPSTPALEAYLDRIGVELEPGWRIEINLRAVEWVRDAARRLRRGFMILIDYGHAAAELYSASHSAGTLTTFSRHTANDAAASDVSTPAWLRDPGRQDITAHVDFTTVRDTAEAEGLTTIGFLDQTYFVLGLLQHLPNLEHGATPVGLNRSNLQLKTLLMPGGLGSTMKVLILGKDVGRPALRGCSYRMRVT